MQNIYSKQSNNMLKMGALRVFDDEWLEISDESTARGIPSLLRVHDWGLEPSLLNMRARKTAETVWMYAVRFLARSHVIPISWQSLLCILVVLSSDLLELKVFFLLSYINLLF